MIQSIQDYLWQFRDPLQSIQLFVLILSIAFAWILDKLYASWFLKHAGTSGAMRQFKTKRTIRRVVFPVTVSILVFLGQIILESLELPIHVLRVVMPLFLALAVVRMLIYFLRATLHQSTWISRGESVISSLVWASFVFYSLGWSAPILAALDGVILYSSDNMNLSLLGIFKLLLMIVFLLLASLWLSNQAERRLQKVSIIDVSMRVAIGKILKFVLITVALLTALSSVGIDFTALTVFGGALGVGLGFGLQRVASNFVSGFILLFDSSIKPGDVITIGNNFGWVVALNARYVVVKNREGVETLIPNENLVTSEVINWSYSDSKVRLKIPVQISYRDDPELAMEIMINAATVQNRVLKEPAPVCRLIKFGDYGINLELRIWIKDPQSGIANVRSAVNLAIWKGFKEAKVTIPYPRTEIFVLNSGMDTDNTASPTAE